LLQSMTQNTETAHDVTTVSETEENPDKTADKKNLTFEHIQT